MTSNKKKLLQRICRPNAGCNCGKSSNPSEVIEPKPKPKPKPKINHQNPNLYRSNSSSSWDKAGDDEDHTSTTFSFCKMVSPCPKISNSHAVVKDSDDPYLDFRQSMLQMISAREIFSEDELRELLNCFLELNSPTHHEIIVRAFKEICNEVGGQHQRSPVITRQPDHET